jgi:hypothetical protein
MKFKESILKLRAEGKSYRQIQKILGCSTGVIALHCNIKNQERQKLRHSLQSRERKERIVNLKGGKCEICGYSKCIAALDFHHKDSNEKDFNISSMMLKSFKRLDEEIGKCLLLCANCHRELHSKENDERYFENKKQLEFLRTKSKIDKPRISDSFDETRGVL